MILVFDSSSLIALTQIGRLDLIQELAGEIHIPVAVSEEITTPGTARVGGEELRLAPWIRIRTVVGRQAVERLRERLGYGESEAIVLARELSADYVVLDDGAARRAAEQEGARVIGLLGLLVHAKDRGMISALQPLFDDLRAAGFYIGDSLYDALLRRAGEI